MVLLHEGGVQTGTLSDINGGEGGLAGSPVAAIVAQLDDAVDVVISGHTHFAYNCKLSNAAGRAIPVSSASALGRALTDIDVTINPATRDVTAAAVTNRLVARNDATVKPHAAVAKIVAAYKGLVDPIANAVIGSIAVALPNTRTDAACNMPAGNLIADGQLHATRSAGIGGAVIALMNVGGVRSPGFDSAQGAAGEGNGNVTYGESFTVQPFGNSLVTMTLTAQDIKDVLEEQFAACKGQAATATRFMLPSAGFKYRWDGARACNARISNVTLTSAGATEVIDDSAGAVVNPVKRFRVTVNNFMADGGDGYATFLKGADRLGRAQDIDALTAYMAQFKAPKAAYDPAAVAEDMGTQRIIRQGTGTACPTGLDVNP